MSNWELLNVLCCPPHTEGSKVMRWQKVTTWKRDGEGQLAPGQVVRKPTKAVSPLPPAPPVYAREGVKDG